MIKSIILGMLLLTIAAFTSAETLSLTWDVPSVNTDGTTLEPTNIKGYVIKYQQEGFSELQLNVDGGTVASIPANVGEYVLSIATVTEEGTGPFSDDITVEVEPAPIVLPEAPTTLQVGITCDGKSCTLKIN